MADKIIQVFDVTPDEFKENIIKDVRLELKAMAQNLKPAEPEEYLTRKQVAKLLQVSLVTIHEWNRKKILDPLRLGTLIRYRRSEIDKALIRINNHDTS
jgi:excisionase family DNA binding protein